VALRAAETAAAHRSVIHAFFLRYSSFVTGHSIGWSASMAVSAVPSMAPAASWPCRPWHGIGLSSHLAAALSAQSLLVFRRRGDLHLPAKLTRRRLKVAASSCAANTLARAQGGRADSAATAACGWLATPFVAAAVDGQLLAGPIGQSPARIPPAVEAALLPV